MKTKNVSQTSWFTKQWESLIWPWNYLSLVDLESSMSKKICLKIMKEKRSLLPVPQTLWQNMLVEGEANETPRETIFIYDPFHEASYQENLNEIKYLLSFVQDCNLVSQPFVKVNFIVLKCHYAIILAYCELQFTTWQYWSIIVHISERRLYLWSFT